SRAFPPTLHEAAHFTLAAVCPEGSNSAGARVAPCHGSLSAREADRLGRDQHAGVARRSSAVERDLEPGQDAPGLLAPERAQDHEGVLDDGAGRLAAADGQLELGALTREQARRGHEVALRAAE